MNSKACWHKLKKNHKIKILKFVSADQNFEFKNEISTEPKQVIRKYLKYRKVSVYKGSSHYFA